MGSSLGRYAARDESGDVSVHSHASHFVVAALLTKAPRAIELHVKRARAALGQRARTEELKASATDESITGRFIQAIAAEEVEVIAAVLDKRAILRPPAEAESLYRTMLERVVHLCCCAIPGCSYGWTSATAAPLPGMRWRSTFVPPLPTSPNKCCFCTRRMPGGSEVYRPWTMSAGPSIASTSMAIRHCACYWGTGSWQRTWWNSNCGEKRRKRLTLGPDFSLTPRVCTGS